MSRIPRFFQYIGKTRKIQPIPSSEDDLISPRLWEIWAQYSSSYRHLLLFGILVQKRQIYLKTCSPLKPKFLKMLSLLLIFYTMTTFLLLCDKLYFKRGDETVRPQKDKVRTWAMFYVTLVFPAIIPSSCIIGFRSSLVCQLFNPAGRFGSRVRGK